MYENIFNKIPHATLTRLYDYVKIGQIGGDKGYCRAKIVTACSVLYDCGYLTMTERAEVSLYFRQLLKDGACEA